VRRGPGAPDYVPTDRVGLGRLPDSLVPELRMRGLITLSTFVAWVEEPVSRRRRSGSTYQEVVGWWATECRLVEVVARREFGAAVVGRLRPAGPWTVGGAVHELVAGVEPSRSVWRHPSAPGRSRRAAFPGAAPLELLPLEVTAPVVGGEAACFVRWDEGWAEESVHAHRLVDGRVRLLRGVRTAAGRGQLDGADWVIETVDAPVVRRTDLALVGHQAVGPGRERRLPA
jgi:hypothetical protein